MSLQLYLKPGDPSLPSLVGSLKRLDVAHNALDIDANPTARADLLKLSGALTVPTLVFDDGTYLVEPTPAQFAEKMLSLQPAQPKPPTVTPVFLLSVWMRICAII